MYILDKGHACLYSYPPLTHYSFLPGELPPPGRTARADERASERESLLFVVFLWEGNVIGRSTGLGKWSLEFPAKFVIECSKNQLWGLLGVWDIAICLCCNFWGFLDIPVIPILSNHGFPTLVTHAFPILDNHGFPILLDTHEFPILLDNHGFPILLDNHGFLILLDNHGWKHMRVYGGIWRYMKVDGSIWKYMRVYGCIWRYMKVYASIWMYNKYMHVYGGIWSYRGERDEGATAAAGEVMPSELYHPGR